MQFYFLGDSAQKKLQLLPATLPEQHATFFFFEHFQLTPEIHQNNNTLSPFPSVFILFQTTYFLPFFTSVLLAVYVLK
jgi:hypothetical protein